MITRRTETLGVVCADMGSPFFAEALRGISDYARDHGFSTLIVNTDEDLDAERGAIALLREKQVEGVIVAPADVQEVGHLIDLQREGRAVVLFDRSSSALEADSVTVDDIAAMTSAVNRLISAGHLRIGIITELRLERESNWEAVLLGDPDKIDPRRLNPSSRRLLGYLKAHSSHGMSIDPALVGRTGAHTATSAREAALRLLREQTLTALITVDNATSVGTYGAIRELGVRIPEDISFIAFDNLDWTTLVTPAISVIEQPVYELGSTAARVIIDRISGRRDEPTRELLLDTRFIERDSLRSL
jgi:LacI family transcriptional regulator